MRWTLSNFYSHVSSIFIAIIKIRNKSLSKGATAIQLLNIAFALVFTYKFGIDRSGIDTAQIYSAFLPFNELNWWLSMPAIVIFQTLFLSIKSLRCDFMSGLVLLASVPAWVFISITFANSEIPNTATGVYAIWAVTCFWAGWRMVDYYYYKIVFGRKGAINARNVNDGDKRTNQPSSGRSDDSGSDGGCSNCTKQD